jgi:hypothetical protein
LEAELKASFRAKNFPLTVFLKSDSTNNAIKKLNFNHFKDQKFKALIVLQIGTLNKEI